MNDRSFQLPDSAALHSDDELAAIRVDRAQTELKHGRALAVLDPQGAAPLLLVAAVETLTPNRLKWFTSLGGPLRLLLTAERCQAIALPQAGAARALPLPAGITVEALQQLGAVLPGQVAPELLHEKLHPEAAGASDATPAMQAALSLAKRGRLTPALLVAEPPSLLPGTLEAAHLLQVSTSDIVRVQRDAHLRLRRVSDARVPIAAHEDCTLVLFRESHGDAEHVAIVVGRPDLAQPVPVRLHSSCLTGDLLGSLRCDCGDQLRDAIERLAETGGVLLYLAQEGRGTGLGNKLRAYRLQDAGLDTIDADRYLGFRSDERDFQSAVAMLKSLGIQRIRLMTNNPKKIEAIRSGGIDVVDRIPLIAPVNPHNARYIDTKRERAGHLRGEEQE
ncbi:GTP cyclohydrolase II [Aquabacterium sp. A7-Y]|uniref:GTP cyclohydrolase II n=1 Tax=Aquabacterium sp. A7-Y TaxID=1349605 RepID=UPI00223E8351|nr:GTP cyclohydrolase II [Aquabacterium sp. A7-Y]MCW7539136.1 GTP cyclohydrolase II [Aquabacterium sp. A7-Y]